MWIICMTTESDGYHTDMKFKRKILYHFLCLKVIPQKTKFNIECLLLSSVFSHSSQVELFGAASALDSGTVVACSCPPYS